MGRRRVIIESPFAERAKLNKRSGRTRLATSNMRGLAFVIPFLKGKSLRVTSSY
jgi:hypothetical protein